jgi:hypothetical protein
MSNHLEDPSHNPFLLVFGMFHRMMLAPRRCPGHEVKGSVHRTACGALSATTEAIQPAPSAGTYLSAAARSSPRRRRTLPRWRLPRPGGPRQVGRVAINNDDQVHVAALMGDLVDADRASPCSE